MATAIHHGESSAKKWGGQAEDYLPIHEWFDETKAHKWHFTHRIFRHHTMGIENAEQIFGRTITNSNGRKVPVRWIGEQHMIEDFGYVPTPEDWLRHVESAAWMTRGAERLSVKFTLDDT